MITLEEAKALKVGDSVDIDEGMTPGNGPWTPTTVSYVDEEHLHVADGAYQFILANCTDGIPILQLPI